jgi:hypothetical protein
VVRVVVLIVDIVQQVHPVLGRARDVIDEFVADDCHRVVISGNTVRPRSIFDDGRGNWWIGFWATGDEPEETFGGIDRMRGWKF